MLLLCCDCLNVFVPISRQQCRVVQDYVQGVEATNKWWTEADHTSLLNTTGALTQLGLIYQMHFFNVWPFFLDNFNISVSTPWFLCYNWQNRSWNFAWMFYGVSWCGYCGSCPIKLQDSNSNSSVCVCVWVREREYVCVRERVCVCTCVCVCVGGWERERERNRVCMCVRACVR